MGQSSAGAGTQITAASLRTPRAAAASYLALRFDLSGREALALTDELIPGPGPNPRFRHALAELYAAA